MDERKGTAMHEQQGDKGVKVLVRDEDWDDVVGHPYRIGLSQSEDVEGQGVRYGGLGQTEDDAEGQVYILKRPEPGEQMDDVEGQGIRGNWIRLEDEDVEGQGIRGHYLVPVTDDDVEGQGSRASWLRPVEDDTEGQGVRYYLEPDDDVEGQGIRYGS